MVPPARSLSVSANPVTASPFLRAISAASVAASRADAQPCRNARPPMHYSGGSVSWLCRPERIDFRG